MGEGSWYHSPTLGRLSFNEVVDEILAMMAAVPEAPYEVVVGTDSQTYADEVDYVSAIVVHRVGRGGRYFWRREKDERPQSLRERIYREAWLSYETAEELIRALKDRGVSGFQLEIHVDIGRNGRTRDLVEEVVGMILGVGYRVRTKPEAYAASAVADRYT
ncbi:MAG TPA: ribonuclease H-like YkuK family protein [Candidatus Bipolaricaulis sp.]|nr:ribonuclease H-like YkuK family protein [Candidatus Bipolaricaulis sp.]HPD06956.1 ribonuclease H-like YkuK family protein [Candidatus Bipolaricaulis sp.]HRS14434.1 ribonuclease H-like YkuK family protein [Candidatus Bipolaricaulis sp.]HRU21252.1 ribonuclease H-like YkuK family protein [Candidatus Bipolaricaulis sp.]